MHTESMEERRRECQLSEMTGRDAGVACTASQMRGRGNVDGRWSILIQTIYVG